MKNQKLELTWIGKENQPKIEPRILIEDKDKSYGDENTENMLIHGDNLLALKALEDKFTNRIKCIYIDPPYNTGSAFDNYDDNLEHSIWLNLMKARLEILKKLLADDGAIFIQIDDGEQAYLKVLCDEIFGRNNFVNCIAIKMSPSSGVKRRFADIKFIKNKEYILVYKKNKINLTPIYDTIDEYDVNYTIFYNKEELCPLNEKIVKIDPLYNDIKVKDYLKIDKIKKFIMKNQNNIYRRHGHSKWVNGNINDNNLEYKKCNEMKSRSHIWRVYNPDNTEEFELIMNTGSESKVGYERLEPISWKIMNNELTLLRGDFWDGYESDMGNVSKEGKNKVKAFGEGQKPERLLKDIIESITEPGDYVLDSFLGSGTTCAVAHKLKRKWIGIELGDQCYTYCKPRLDDVIDGEQSGVSEKVHWQGGGGYKLYELAPSLLVKDKFNNWIISENYNGELLTKAICKQEKFDYIEKSDSYWKQGKSSENDYIFVTTNYISIEYLDAIHEEMRNDESLLICCKTYQEECEERYDNITIKKIPQSILNNCEYGKDDYSLNVNEVLEIDEDE